MGLINHLCKQRNLNFCKQLKSLSNFDTLLNINNQLFIKNQDVRYAGHSKWQNIRHTKATKDGLKSKLFNKIATSITRAALKGADPKFNKELSNILEMCKRQNISKDLIDRALKRASTQKLQLRERGFIGPNNIIGIVNFLYDARFNKPSVFLKPVTRIYKDFKFVNAATLISHFYKKGIIYISKYDRNKNPVSFEKIEEIAIEAEAEEIKISSEEDKIIPPLLEVIEDEVKGKSAKKVVISPDEDELIIDPAYIWKLVVSEEGYFQTKGKIERDFSNLIIKKNSIEYVAKEIVNLSENDFEEFNKFVQALNEIEEFENLYANVEFH